MSLTTSLALSFPASTPAVGSFKFNYATTSGASIYSAPAIDTNGRVYFGSIDTRFRAVNSAGTLSWSYQCGTDVENNHWMIFASPVLDATNVYFQTLQLDDDGNALGGGNLTSLTSNGIFGIISGKFSIICKLSVDNN